MNPEVESKFATYPEDIRNSLLAIRGLIFDIAAEQNLGDVEESLKWGQPSYVVKGGSPVRLGWKAAEPDQLSLFFNCNTTLVATFREVYGGELEFIGNRELVIRLHRALPLQPLQHCLRVALHYHRVKGLPLLGM